MTAINESAAVDQAVTEDRIRASPTDNRRPRGIRRFFRFNLLALLIALLVVAIYFGVRQRFAVSQEENQAKRELWDLSASYTLSPAYPVWIQYALLQFGEDAQHVDHVAFPPFYPNVNDVREAKRLSAKDLAPLARLPHLRKVDLSQTIFDDGALATLMHNRELEELTLSETLVGDAGIERLAGHPTLSVVRIDRTLTSDEALNTLARLPNLEEVWLDDSTTGQGIAALAEAPQLAKVHALFTALRDEDLQPLAKRQPVVLVPPRRSIADDSLSDDDSLRSAARYDGAYWVRAGHRPLSDPAFLARFETMPNVSVVNVHHGGTIDPENLASLLALPQILEIYFDVQGPPVSYARIEEVAKRVRPADAAPCIVYGNVTITGEELVYECAKVRNVKRRPTGPIYAPYVVVDLRPEHIERLSELANSTDVRVQPHVVAHPSDWVNQSSLLSELSPVFVQIPLP